MSGAGGGGTLSGNKVTDSERVAYSSRSTGAVTVAAIASSSMACTVTELAAGAYARQSLGIAKAVALTPLHSSAARACPLIVQHYARRQALSKSEEA